MGLNRETDFSPGHSKEAVLAKTIAFKSIGCRTNQEETAALSRRLVDAGHRVVDKIDKAEIIIVNTCSVTAEAESKTLRFLHAVSKVASSAKICLTGCFAQRSPEGFRAMAGVHWVVGNTRKNDIPEILLEESGGVYWGECSSASERPLPCVREPDPPAEGPRTRFFIKIQEGCDNRCAYCIVPLLRGKSRSASFYEILTVCRKAVEAGYKEVVLTGTHIGQYRESGRGDMLSLVEELVALPGDFRLRLSSIDPRDLTERLLSVIINEKKVCKHLHVSVQSFSASVAAAMGRGGPYLETTAHRLASFRKSAPDAGIGGDFIVGFPGETESMFM
jgi:threonylcarbamoyladenosine tRNA methylthiotransferase MtaB